MNYSVLEESINNNEVEKVIELLSEIGKNKEKEAIPLLIKYLKCTNNNVLRNEIAITLSDIGSIEAIEPIIDMLKSPMTEGCRGTLLYALQSFDCTGYIELFVDLLMENSFEVSRESLNIIESIVKNISEEIKQKCISKVKNEIESLQDKIDFLDEALEVLMV